MRFLVVGAGGVGGYFGGKLAADGNEVVFVARGAHREAMARDGLTVHAETGEIRIDTPLLHESPETTGLCDVVLVCVKLWDLAPAADLIRPCLGQDSAVVPLQNGVAAVDILSERLGAPHVLGGVAQVAARIERPGVIRQTGGFQRLVFGERDGSRSWRAESLLAACEAAGIDALLSERIEVDIWRKFVLLAPMAGAAGLHRASLGTVLADPAHAAQLEALVAETLAVARAKGVALPDDLLDKTLKAYRGMPDAMKPSMLHDLEAGRRLELDWLNGQVVKLGRELGVATPENAAVQEALTPYALGGPA